MSKFRSSHKSTNKPSQKGTSLPKQAPTPLKAPTRPKRRFSKPPQTPAINWLLGPNQTVPEFLKLKAEWDAKLAAEGLPEMEGISEYGYRGPYGRVSRLPDNKEGTFEWFMEVSQWMHRADFSKFEPNLGAHMAKFILELYVEGFSLRDMLKVLHNEPGAKPLPDGLTLPQTRNSRRNGANMPKLFWLHKSLNLLLEACKKDRQALAEAQEQV